jgi:transcriptional regulator with GAF, ATPase, and Fis domain
MVSASNGPQAEMFAEVARSLLAESDVQTTLQRIVDLAVDTIDGCDHAGITFLHAGVFTTPAASDDVPVKVDEIQYETGEGPCIDAMRDHEVFRTGDLGSEERWPEFAGRAQRETGITSMMGFRLFVAEDTLGALNVYSKRADAFDDDACAAGSVFAAHAAVALATAQHDEQMDQALASRDVIGQAKGILMAKEGITADEAFDVLRRASQRLNMKLRLLAEEIARTGVTPPVPAGSSPAAAPEGDEAGG